MLCSAILFGTVLRPCLWGTLRGLFARGTPSPHNCDCGCWTFFGVRCIYLNFSGTCLFRECLILIDSDQLNYTHVPQLSLSLILVRLECLGYGEAWSCLKLFEAWKKKTIICCCCLFSPDQEHLRSFCHFTLEYTLCTPLWSDWSEMFDILNYMDNQ